ncbi:hypothetical protein KCU91_g3267, partial [Aureobasidium melanogenum]
MFYEIGTDHGLPYDPFKACVVPRPIGWISTRSPSGHDNLAPYSQFTNLTFDPPYVLFSSNRTPLGQRKDTVNNAIATGFFAWNLATYALREEVNVTAQQLDPGEDEFVAAGLEKEEGRVVGVDIIFGRVLAVHISDSVLTDGKIDIKKTEPIARLGYYEYAVVRDTFEMRIPGTNKALSDGLEGSAKANRKLENGEEESNKAEVVGQLKRSQSAGAEAALGGGE